MNAISSGQSLLLAGGTMGSSSRPGSPIGDALSVITSGATLRRVTLVSEQPDARVVVRADYSGGNEPAVDDPSSSSPPKLKNEPIEVSWTEVESEAIPSGGDGKLHVRLPGGSSSGNPLWQYARTQGGAWATPIGANLDVRA
ncbi:MAG: hypothetical protein ABSF94_19475 [Steroidobacteraceae bacterium]